MSYIRKYVKIGVKTLDVTGALFMKRYSTIIIGSGVAALQLAKHLRKDKAVLLLTKGSLEESNSFRAQGGIAAALGEDDVPALHYEDTLEAGCYIHNEEAVRQMTNAAPVVIQSMAFEGMAFDKEVDGQLMLGMEGAHQHNRIVHSGGDATGKHLIYFLRKQLSENITVLEHHFVFELIIDPRSNRCVGVKAKNSQGAIVQFMAHQVVLATGGVGQLYSFTSNTETVTGDGIALALAAGAEVVDMEFIQFHPTLLFVNGRSKGLISEAVRGAGGRLVNHRDELIMKKRHEQTDLAPRHIVAKAIYEERAQGHEVYLDITAIENFRTQFPTITKLCEDEGIKIESGLLPVAPGCHFLMGGVHVNQIGQTSVEGLYAIGEVARTGVHGANRLASNSLLEGLYFGMAVANHLNNPVAYEIRSLAVSNSDVVQGTILLPRKSDIQQRMMELVGIIRKQETLIEMKKWLQSYPIDNVCLAQFTNEEIEVIFMLQVSRLITESALTRKESRGAHCREDFPQEQNEWQNMQIYHSKNGIEQRGQHYEYIKVTDNA